MADDGGFLSIYPVDSDETLAEGTVLHEAQRDQDSVTLKTSEGSGPWFFELVVLQGENMIDLRMSFDGTKGDYKDVLNHLKLLRTIKQNGKIVLEVVPLNERLVMPVDPGLAGEVSDGEMAMVGDLIYIQERLAQHIPVAEEYPDPALVRMTKDFLESGKLEIPPRPFELSGSKYDVSWLVAKLKERSPVEEYGFTVLQMPIKMGGTLLRLPPTKITMKSVVLAGDIDGLERKISSLRDDENVTFTIQSTSDENIVYEIAESR